MQDEETPLSDSRNRRVVKHSASEDNEGKDAQVSSRARKVITRTGQARSTAKKLAEEDEDNDRSGEEEPVQDDEPPAPPSFPAPVAAESRVEPRVVFKASELPRKSVTVIKQAQSEQPVVRPVFKITNKNPAKVARMVGFNADQPARSTVV